MNLSEDKCRFLLSGCKHEMIWANNRKTKIWESRKQNLLKRIIIKRNMRFDEYILNQCKKVPLSALTTVCLLKDKEPL